MFKSLLLASLAAAPLSVHPGIAQTPSADKPLGGSVVSGVCLLSRPAVLEHSKVGMAATRRLQDIARQVQSEIASDRQPIDAERQAYQADMASLTPEQRLAREQALGQRIKALQAKIALRDREIEATRAKAQGRIANEMRPVVEQAYQARGCGLLIDRTIVLGGNMANDLTPTVVQGLDARINTISFDRETLPVTTSS